MHLHAFMHKKRLAIHSFGPCSACQLAFLQPGADLLRLGRLLDIQHCLDGSEAECQADIALVAGCLDSTEQQARLQRIRSQSQWLVSLGSCATHTGLHALQGSAALDQHVRRRSPQAGQLAQFAQAHSIDSQVHVDVHLHGCPIRADQVFDCLRHLLLGQRPPERQNSVCAECQLHGHACLPVHHAQVCLGAVTRAGCQARCIADGQGCYGCAGALPGARLAAQRRQLARLGLPAGEIAARMSLLCDGESQANEPMPVRHGKPPL